jgi:tRNA threonylcarbamoyladenosine biosynthesis protein TsaE
MTHELHELDLFARGPEQMRAIGRRLGEVCTAGDVIGLLGPLGAGKTCLAQGIAAGLGVPGDVAVASPTFSIVHEYRGRLPMYHMDFYRLEGADFEEAGLEEYLDGSGVVVVEWAERWPSMLDHATLLVRIATAGGERRLRCETGTARLARALAVTEA